MHKLFNSRSTKYRNPTGAVATGTQVHFKVCLPRHLCAQAVNLLLRNEHGGEEEIGNMFWCGMDDNDHEWWEVDFTPKNKGLWLYYFEIIGASGKQTMGRTWSGRAEITSTPARWQLSVYDADFTTPDWLSGGIIYQIFPDRFAKSGETHENIPYGRKIHENWDEQMDFRPDAQGRITNSDFFGGDFKGITEHLPHLKSLGVTCLYLNPIFESHENHRYATASYERVDPMLGTEEDFRELCEKAHELGIYVILDGVFSHTGRDSMYFNYNGRYDTIGAYNSVLSPYYKWYSFSQYPDRYASWWGIDTLPEVNETCPEYLEYICGENGILRKWLRAGADGWRLDVADELPDGFLDALNAAVKAENPDALIMGEVWEDATNKIAYDVRRRYLLGGQLDTVMNYPFKDAVIGFMLGWDARSAMESILSILENYPKQCTRLLMNLLGTHDTMRVLTLLGGENVRGRDREWQAKQKMSAEERARAINLLHLATLMQYTLPGVPAIYYGDEAGLEGYLDPFNRATYPWGKEDQSLIEWYTFLGKMRTSLRCLAEGEFEPIDAHGSFMAYTRRGEGEAILLAVNAAWNNDALTLPAEFVDAECLYGDYSGGEHLVLSPTSAVLLRIDIKEEEAEEE